MHGHALWWKNMVMLDANMILRYLLNDNQEMADILRKETGNTLSKVLYELSNQMKNSYARSDA